jgi:hypothetical protein
MTLLANRILVVSPLAGRRVGVSMRGTGVGVVVRGRTVTWFFLVMLLVLVSRAAAGSALTAPKNETTIVTSLRQRSPTAHALDQLAVNVAAGAGNMSPSTATWIATTRAKAMALMDSAPSDAIAAEPVWVMVVQGGHFLRPPRDSCPSRLRRRCNLPPYYTAIVAIIEQSSGGVTDFGETNRAPSLSVLGNPETDPLGRVKSTEPSG